MQSKMQFAWISFTLLAGGCAGTYAPQAAVQVPEALKPRAQESLALVVPAKGVQIYECRAAGGTYPGYEWAFVAPQADLYDASGTKIGIHYAGPHWEAADGSKIVGKVMRRAEAPAANAIPWLLLEAKSVGAKGAFSGVSSIQRVATAGGQAPEGGCSRAGEQVRVPYTADYYFFTAR